MSTFVIPVEQAVTFRRQPSFTYCGHTQIQTFLHTFKQYTHAHHPKQFSLNLLSKITGYMFPQGYSQILHRHGFQAQIETCPSTDTLTVLSHLKGLLKEHQKPVLLLIGHGYTDRRLKGNLLRQIFLQHYISVRGYDAEGFYAYDSSLHDHDSTLPIGNLYLPNTHLIKYRKRSYLGLKRYLYVRVL